MRFDHLFIAFCVFAGAVLGLLGQQSSALFGVVPPLMPLLIVILLFDLDAAYARGLPVMTSVPTQTRVIAFIGGAIALILSGGSGS